MSGPCARPTSRRSRWASTPWNTTARHRCGSTCRPPVWPAASSPTSTARWRCRTRSVSGWRSPRMPRSCSPASGCRTRGTRRSAAGSSRITTRSTLPTSPSRTASSRWPSSPREWYRSWAVASLSAAVTHWWSSRWPASCAPTSWTAATRPGRSCCSPPWPASAGSLAVVRRRATAAQRATATACLLIFAAGAAVLLGSDVFQFSWRYQLPALITLPPAGALGLTVIGGYLASRRRRPARPQPPRLSPSAGEAGEGPTGGRLAGTPMAGANRSAR